jgi:hypothetical protein
MTTTERCGPHCGVKDKITGHCTGCHAKLDHGNALWRPAGWKVVVRA